MTSTNAAAVRYFENEFNRDVTFFHIGTCPHGSFAFVKKGDLPDGLNCCCLNDDRTVREDHTWGAITLVIDLRKIVPDKKKTTKRDLLDSLNRWLEVKDMTGQQGSNWQFLHASSASLQSDTSSTRSWETYSSSANSSGRATSSGRAASRGRATSRGRAGGLSYASGTDDEDSLETITVIDSIGGSAIENIRVIISNIVSIAKSPLKLFSFAVNGYYLVKAMANADIPGVIQHIQPFVGRFAPHWLRYMNDAFYQELGGVLQQQRIQQQFGVMQQGMEEKEAARAAADASDGVLHLNELERALGSRGC